MHVQTKDESYTNLYTYVCILYAYNTCMDNKNLIVYYVTTMMNWSLKNRRL